MNVNDSNIFAVDEDRLPISGRISAGIQRLTANAAKSIPGANEIVAEGEQAGATYDEIITHLLNKAPKAWGRKRPMVPQNVDFFRAAEREFMNPANAHHITETYGEDRGAGVQVYAFPVIFPVDDIDTILLEGFSMYKGSKIVYWRDGAGQCVEMPDVEKGRRRFGARKPAVRKDVCDPNTCDEFAAEQCNHTAELLFYIPGVTGVGAIQLKFRSIYAAIGIRKTLQTTLRGLGRISGTMNGKPIFWISKRKEQVNRVDWSSGTVSRVEQWIITLEARSLDMAAYFAQQEQSAKVGKLEAPVAAPNIDVNLDPTVGLNQEEFQRMFGEASTPAAAPAKPDPLEETLKAAIPEAPAAEEPTPKAPRAKKEPRKADTTTPPDIVCRRPDAPATETPPDPSRRRPDSSLKDARADVFSRAEFLGLDRNEFGEWGLATFGEDCFKNVENIDRVFEVLAEAEQTGDMDFFKRPAKTGAKEETASPETEELPF